MGKMERKTKIFMISMIFSLIVMILSGTILLLPTSTWLSQEKSVENSSTIKVAEATIDVLNNSTTLTTSNNTVTLGASGSKTTGTFKIKNTGTASTLVRLYYCLKGDDGETTLTTDDVAVVFNSVFIEHERADTAWAGYLFLNKEFAVNEIQNIFTSFTPTTAYANKTITIQIQAECVLYSGNAYTQNLTPKPWDSVPSNWFVLTA